MIHMCQSTATGLTTRNSSMLQGRSSTLSRMRCAHVGTHVEGESAFKRRGRAVRYRLRSNRGLGSNTTLARVAVQSSTPSTNRLKERTGGVQTEPGRMKHIESKMHTVQE